MVDPVRAVARLSERFQPRESGEGQESSSFAKMLADAFDAANQAQWDADRAARLLAKLRSLVWAVARLRL